MVSKKVLASPTSLKFLVQDIPEEGFHLAYDISQDELALTQDEGRILGTLHLDCEIRHSSEGICVKGTLSGSIIYGCVRCLCDCQEQIVLPCLGLFQDDQSEAQSSTITLDEESYDIGLDEIEEIYSYQDNRIELDTMLREQVILITPIQRICQPDCRGLCQHCGINLNQSVCSCSDDVGFSPMVAALQKLKQQL
ncbi:MAG: YceD family protein [Nitrospirales bacterium]